MKIVIALVILSVATATQAKETPKQAQPACTEKCSMAQNAKPADKRQQLLSW